MSETCVGELAVQVGKVAHAEAMFADAGHKCVDHNQPKACEETKHWSKIGDEAYLELKDLLRRCKFGEGVE